MKYFIDTYAIIEIIKGNPNYKKYTEEDFVTSIFNLYELYFNILKTEGEQIAQEYYYQFKQFLIEIADDYIFNASNFKFKNNKSDISYTDALGYTIAIDNGLKFLTGDKEFKELDNVEFVK